MALVTVLLVMVVLAAVTASAAMIGSNAYMMTHFEDRHELLAAAADAGLEEGRAKINGNKALYPDTGYATLENNVPVYDASGAKIPGVTRSTYVGPTGVVTGQYGVFGGVVSVIRDGNGDQIVRREEVVQESFAKFAYFTDVEPSNIYFGNNDQLYGPVHSNDVIKSNSSGVTFHGPVTTAKTVTGPATYAATYTEHVPRIAMPALADLNKLKTYATTGGMTFTSTLNGAEGAATMRIEFVAVDLNGDGNTTGDDEGFVKIYTSAIPEWVVADFPAGKTTLQTSPNCGHWSNSVIAGSPHAAGGVATFRSAVQHTTANNNAERWDNELTSATRRCYLGGSDSLTATGTFTPNDGKGTWLPYPGVPDPRLTRSDKAYLFPISRDLNPNWKGVIFVTGRVAISGTLRGRVTLAATENIVIVDDMRYATDPAAGTCADMLGLFAGGDVVVADNTLNSPADIANNGTYYNLGKTSDENINGVILTLNNFHVENYDQGSTNAQPCNTTTWGRGCLYLTGGIIQETRGAVGTGSGTGYVKRYSYDACAGTSPPPYFPTTGRFAKGRYYDVDPTNFSVKAYYELLTPNK